MASSTRRRTTELPVKSFASLAYMERVRTAVRAHGSCADLPLFVESDHGAVRTQRELRWKVKHRYPSLFSLSVVGLKLLLDEVRALVLRRSSPLEWSGQRTAVKPDPLSGSAEEG